MYSLNVSKLSKYRSKINFYYVKTSIVLYTTVKIIIVLIFFL